MTEVSLDIIFNVSESGSHLRCCGTRNKTNCSFDLYSSYPLMFLDSFFELLLLGTQGIVNLTSPKNPRLDEPSVEYCVRVSLMYSNFSTCSSPLGSSLNCSEGRKLQAL